VNCKKNKCTIPVKIATHNWHSSRMCNARHHWGMTASATKWEFASASVCCHKSSTAFMSVCRQTIASECDDCKWLRVCTTLIITTIKLINGEAIAVLSPYYSKCIVHEHIHCEAKKLHHFIFAITLSYLSLFEQLLVYIYPNKFGTKWHQSHQSPLKGVLIPPYEMQHTYTLWPTSILSCKFKHHHYRLEV